MANTNNNEIAIAKVNTTEKATENFLIGIREIAKSKSSHSEAYNAVREYLAAEKGALKWLLNIKENHDDRINVNKNFGFNASDMLGDIIAKRTAALAAVAYDVNIKDVIEDLESVAWCCGICGISE